MRARGAACGGVRERWPPQGSRRSRLPLSPNASTTAVLTRGCELDDEEERGVGCCFTAKQPSWRTGSSARWLLRWTNPSNPQALDGADPTVGST